MKIGGYQIIDCKGVALTDGTASTIKGTGAAVSGANGKRFILSGLKVGTTAYNDVEIELTESSGTWTGSAYGYTIEITDEDSVTATTPTP